MTSAGNRGRAQASPHDTRWANGRVRGDGGKEIRTLWVVAAGWNALAVPLAIAWWTRRGTDAWPPFLDVVLALFVGVGPLILGQASVATWRWRRFRHVELVLDPFPGSLGGHVGGSVEVPGVRPGNAPGFVMTLAAVRRTVSGGTGGRNRRVWESVVWSRSLRPRVEAAALGVRLHFTFEVPTDLPPSEVESDDRVFWAVRVRGALPGADLDRVFEVPVLATPEPVLAEVPALAEEVPLDRKALSPSVVRVRSAPGGTRLEYPRGRNATAGLVMTAFGIVFAGAGRYVLDAAGGWRGVPGAGVSVAAATALLAGTFGAFGAVLAGAGLFEALNRLTVELSGERIRATRSILLRLRRAAPVSDVERVALTVSGQVGQGARANVTYRITAWIRGGKKIPLGDGMVGSEAALRVARLVTEATGLEVVEDAEPRR